MIRYLKGASCQITWNERPPRRSHFGLNVFRWMCVGHDGTTAGWDHIRGGWSFRRHSRFGIQHRHFFIFAILLGLKDGNVLAGRIKDRTNFGFFRRRVLCRVRFQFRHEVINFDTKGLFTILDFPI